MLNQVQIVSDQLNNVSICSLWVEFAFKKKVLMKTVSKVPRVGVILYISVSVSKLPEMLPFTLKNAAGLFQPKFGSFGWNNPAFFNPKLGHLGEKTPQHFSTQIWVKYGQTQMLG